jgi:hypothetical protein
MGAAVAGWRGVVAMARSGLVIGNVALGTEYVTGRQARAEQERQRGCEGREAGGGGQWSAHAWLG